MNVLIAPDKFRGALDAADAAAALAAGVYDARPDAEVVTCPLGDGGEGTGGVLAAALGATPHRTAVLDPLGRSRAATWWWCADRRLAVIEMAEASGLVLLRSDERDPLRTTSYGTGQLIVAAVEHGATRVLLAVGGSATVDGGAGCLQALGWRLIDRGDNLLREPIGGGRLTDVARVARGDTPSVAIDVLCDVDNPLLGPRGAVAVFAPQKGADATAVARLETALEHWARRLAPGAASSRTEQPGAGAAGGLPFGLAALCEARLHRGFDVVAEHVALHDRLAGCDLCLTGEGRIDDQTVGGKTVAGVAALARRRGVPVIAVGGAARLRAGQSLADLAAAVGVDRIVVITPPGLPLDEALAGTAVNLRRAAREILANWP